MLMLDSVGVDLSIDTGTPLADARCIHGEGCLCIRPENAEARVMGVV